MEGADWSSQKLVSASLEQLSDDESRAQLNDDMNSIDLSRVASIHQRCTQEAPHSTSDHFEPLSTIRKVTSPEDYQRWESLGLKSISQNQVAVVLLAGGQGSRLGYEHPKGMYNFNLPSQKSLFQIQAERIQNLRRRADSANLPSIPWYIMTSDSTDAETKEFFASHNYFGLPAEDVVFFLQKKLPATDPSGQIVMSSPSSIFQAPDGNGGVYAALEKSGNLDDMKKRGIQTIFMYGVDNALVRVADPVFVGSFEESGLPCGSKVVPKSYPEERVGILCKKNGIVQVIEYSEISEEMAHQRNEETQELTYNAGNIVTHIYTLDCLQDVSRRAEEMPYHLAKKEVRVYDPVSKEYTSQMAYKYEQFVFDAFQLVEDIFALEVVRCQEFTAIKNKSGNDSPASALSDYSKYHRTLLENAGVNVEGDGLVEISPLISYAGENLDHLRSQTLQTPVEVNQ